MLVVTAIVQFGIAYNHYLQLTDAVRTGARVASLSSQAASGAPACAAVQAAAPSLTLTCSAQPSPDWSSGSDVKLTATSNYSISIFGVPVTNVPLTSSTTERIE